MWRLTGPVKTFADRRIMVLRSNNLKKGLNPRDPGEFWEILSRMGCIQKENEILDYSVVNGMISGETVVILGSGFSGRGVNWEALRKSGVKTIGVNHIIEHYEPDFLIFQDHRFMKRNKYPLEKFPGYIFAANNNPYVLKLNHKRVVRFRPIKGKRISTHINNGLFSRVSTGLCALNLAVIMRARKIYLLGCDTPKDWEKYDYSQGTHIIPGYNGEINTKEAIQGYLKSLVLYKAFAGHSAKIINVCAGGMIPYFQQIAVKDFNKILSGQ